MSRKKESSMSPLVFIDWANDPDVDIGDEVEYHRGPYVSGKPIAATAREAALDGRVFLFCHRYGPSDFGYRARRISVKAARTLRPTEYEYEW